MKQQPLCTRKFDLAGNGFWRVFRLNVLNRCIPLGNFRGGTGFKPALVLLALHWVGRPCFYFLIRYERQMTRLYQLLRRGC